MDNIRPEGNKYQYITYTSVETLERNFHVSCAKRIRKYPLKYDPGFWSEIEYNIVMKRCIWNNKLVNIMGF